MAEDYALKLLKEAIRAWRARPPEERFQERVRRGAIDEQGNLLIRMPQPPEEPTKNSESALPLDQESPASDKRE